MIGRLRGRRPADIALRAWQLGLARGERWGLLDAGPADAASLGARLRRNGRSTAAPGWDDFVQACAESALAGLRDPGAAAGRATHCAGHLDRVRGEADAIMEGRFHLLGLDPLEFGRPVDWHLDPVSGRRGPMVHWSRVPYLDAAVVGDHKVVWELNRHAGVVRLAQAERLLPHQGYGPAARALLSSWLEANPPKRGMNWCSSLEVALRAIAWLWSARLLDLGTLDPALWSSMLASLYVHARHIERHLSTAFSPNTHLTGEALGLLYLGKLLPCLDRADAWRSKGRDILWQEASRQLRSDGTYFEQSSYYHRYTIDFYIHAALLLGGPHALPPAVRERLTAAVAALGILQRPDGTTPLIGDDDGGRLLPLDGRALDDFRDTLEIGARLFGTPAELTDGPTSAERSWLLPADVSASLPTGAIGEHRVLHVLPEGGIAVMRSDRSSRAHWAMLLAGPHGAVNGAHAHADALAIELAVSGTPFLVDGGTFTYTGPERDRFRGVLGHCVALLDGTGSATPGSMFRWATEADAAIERQLDAEDLALVAGSHDGFRDLGDQVRYHRALMWLGEGDWLLEDHVESSRPHRLTLGFLAAPGIASRVSGPEATLTHRATGRVLRLHATQGEWHAEPAWASNGFGRRDDTIRLRLELAPDRSHRVMVALLGADHESRLSVAERIAATNPGLRLRRPDGHGLLVECLTDAGPDAPAWRVRWLGANGESKRVIQAGADGPPER